MKIFSIVVEGQVCRDMYDEHPGVAYFYVDGRQQLALLKALSVPDAMEIGQAAWHRLRGEAAQEETAQEYDGQFTATRLLLVAESGAVVQCFDGDCWATEFDSPEEWTGLLAKASELEADASFEAGWDNFSTAEGLRARAAALRRRVSISQAHFGVLPEPVHRRKQPVQRMRGLDERCAYALARILQITDPETAAADMVCVEMEAGLLGMRDYREGIEAPPIMFADEPALLAAWKSGQDSAADMEELENCAECQNPALPLCSYHG